MRPDLLPNLFRFVILVLLQVLVLKGMTIPLFGGYYLLVLLYPLFLLLLPIPTPGYLVVFLGFVLGLVIDLFYNSPGVHAGAAVFTGFMRQVAINLNEPRGGYTQNYPTLHSLGSAWFLRYAAPLLLIHCLVYFSLETFNFYYITSIFIKSISAFLASSLFVALYMVIFNPKV